MIPARAPVDVEMPGGSFLAPAPGMTRAAHGHVAATDVADAPAIPANAEEGSAGRGPGAFVDVATGTRAAGKGAAPQVRDALRR